MGVPRVPTPVRPVGLKIAVRLHGGDGGFVLIGLGKDVGAMSLRATNSAIVVIPSTARTVAAKIVAKHKARGTANDGDNATSIGALQTIHGALSLRGQCRDGARSRSGMEDTVTAVPRMYDQAKVIDHSLGGSSLAHGIQEEMTLCGMNAARIVTVQRPSRLNIVPNLGLKMAHKVANGTDWERVT